MNDIKEILSKYKKIAMVGVSNDPTKASTIVMKYMQKYGFKVYPVNPKAEGQKILGEDVCGKITDIKDKVDIVNVFRPSKEALDIARDTINIKANFAKEIGLINDCFSKSKLNNEVLKIAKKIASKSNLTIKIGKRTFYKQLEMPLRKAYAHTSKMMTINMMALDAKEGISAFLEKRKPNWKNK